MSFSLTVFYYSSLITIKEWKFIYITYICMCVCVHVYCDLTLITSKLGSLNRHTSWRNLTGQTPWRLSPDLIITIPSTSSPTWITIWSRSNIRPLSPSDTCNLQSSINASHAYVSFFLIYFFHNITSSYIAPISIVFF